MIPTLTEKHVKILEHLSHFRIYEVRPMPFATTALGMSKIVGMKVSNIYHALYPLEAAGLIEVREAHIADWPAGRSKKIAKVIYRCYQATEDGRTLAQAYRLVYPSAFESESAPAGAQQTLEASTC